jgi:hypothetical protein
VVTKIDAARSVGGLAGLYNPVKLPALGVLARDEKITGADSAACKPWRELLASWGVSPAKKSWDIE